jgi:predicted ATP-dependent serine protease
MPYQCQRCKRIQPNFTTRCLFCAGFLTLEKIKDPLLILSLDEIETPELKFFKTPIDENLSSGLPERTITVIAGLPGAGKSTLALQIANEILKREEPQNPLHLIRRTPRTNQTKSTKSNPRTYLQRRLQNPL